MGWVANCLGHIILSGQSKSFTSPQTPYEHPEQSSVSRRMISPKEPGFNRIAAMCGMPMKCLIVSLYR